MSYFNEVATMLIEADTVSSKGNRPVMQEMADALDGFGFSVELQGWGEGEQAKANLIAVAGPPVPGGLILSGHLDIVPFADQPGWTRDPLRLEIGDERVYGRGTSDMKVFLAQCLEAARRLRPARLVRPVVMLFTSDEEVGCQGAGRLVDDLPRLMGSCPQPSLCWIGEPTSYQVFHAHKGVVAFGVSVRGRGGHSSVPEAGANAIAAAAQVVSAIGELQSELRGRPSAEFAPLYPEAPYTTLNFGVIRGGSAANMIADSCDLVVSYRPLPDEDALAVYERVRVRLQELVLTDWGSDLRPELEIGPALAAPGLNSQRGTLLEQSLRARLDQTGVGGAPFCTDGGHFARAGIDSIICGPGDLDQAHQPDESLPRAAFETGADHVLHVTHSLCTGTEV